MTESIIRDDDVTHRVIHAAGYAAIVSTEGDFTTVYDSEDLEQKLFVIDDPITDPKVLSIAIKGFHAGRVSR